MQIGRSRGGLSTKIHAATDGHGRPLMVLLSQGQQADIRYAYDVLCRVVGRVALRNGPQQALPEYVLADKGYDAEHFVAYLDEAGITPVIPPRKNRRELREMDTERYKHRNQVERFFNSLKQSRHIATRYEKTARNYLAFITLAMIMHYLTSLLLSTRLSKLTVPTLFTKGGNIHQVNPKIPIRHSRRCDYCSKQ